MKNSSLKIAICIFTICVIVKIILTIIELVSKTELSLLSFVTLAVASGLVGQLFTSKSKQGLSKITRLNSSIIFAVFDTLYSLFIFFIIGVGNSLGFSRFLVLTLLGSAIAIPIVYFGLGFGSRQMLKTLEKRNKRSQ